jgi:hypothetical protein
VPTAPLEIAGKTSVVVHCAHGHAPERAPGEAWSVETTPFVSAGACRPTSSAQGHGEKRELQLDIPAAGLHNHGSISLEAVAIGNQRVLEPHG